MIGTQELAHRRRFVSQALRGHLPDDAVNTAVRLCDEFAGDPAFSLVKFLDRLAAVDRQTVPLRPTLFVALQRARIHGAPTAEPPAPRAAAVPLATAAAPPPLSARVAEEPAGWHTVFNIATAALFERLRVLKAGSAEAAVRQLLAELSALSISEATATEVSRSARRGVPEVTARAERRELHLLLHELYLWACDTFGPVSADKLFAAALDQARRHPAAAGFPPHALM